MAEHEASATPRPLERKSKTPLPDQAVSEFSDLPDMSWLCRHLSTRNLPQIAVCTAFPVIMCVKTPQPQNSTVQTTTLWHIYDNFGSLPISRFVKRKHGGKVVLHGKVTH
ncbi:hypothetical protein DPMN_167242 [Dreissena polymorpha]|uniref:Uncharacterized protein n=1 Tax=Dreissena polymorpha TaxID=45954 RepID=A0A9D4F0H9_DREPO|nr:hypothetical protein DPMN_167242 [Dreissena polymorpha]